MRYLPAVIFGAVMLVAVGCKSSRNLVQVSEREIAARDDDAQTFDRAKELSDTNSLVSQNIYASSVGNADEARFVLDANIATGWSSDRNKVQWIVVDLGSPKIVKNVQLMWGDSPAKKYKLMTSLDENTWYTVFSDENGKGQDQNIEVGETIVRYLKIYCSEPMTTNGKYSIKEFRAFGR